jgi:hypothetical protein
MPIQVIDLSPEVLATNEVYTTPQWANSNGWTVDPTITHVVLTNAEYAELTDPLNFENYGVTPEQILLVLTWGMGYILLMWSLGFGVGTAKNMISKL